MVSDLIRIEADEELLAIVPYLILILNGGNTNATLIVALKVGGAKALSGVRPLPCATLLIFSPDRRPQSLLFFLYVLSL